MAGRRGLGPCEWPLTQPHGLTVGETTESAHSLDVLILHVSPCHTHRASLHRQVEEMQSLYETKAESQMEEEEEEVVADKTALLQQIVALLRPGETVLKVQYTAVSVCHVMCM